LVSSDRSRRKGRLSEEEKLKRKARKLENGREWGKRNRRAKPEQMMLERANKRAKKIGVECTITIDHIMVPPICPVLGVPMAVGGGDFAPSLDRIDNNRGYVPGNVIVVSMLVNKIKINATPAQIMAVAKFYERLG
jgi:hypothetical protein